MEPMKINSPADPADNSLLDDQKQVPSEVGAAISAPVMAENSAPVMAENPAPVMAENPAPVMAENPAPVMAENPALMSFLEWIHALLSKDSSWPHRALSFRDALAAAETCFDACPQLAKFTYYDALDDGVATFSCSALCNRLKLIFHHPQLAMEVSPGRNRTLLHAVVAVSSPDAVQKLLNVVTASPQRLEYIRVAESVSGFTAYEMAWIVGNRDIAEMIARCEGGEVVCPPKRDLATTATTRIGEVLKLHLEPLGFDDLPLKIMGLGDEFRLHVSLLTKGWAAVKPAHVYYIARIIFAELDAELATFLSLRDAGGRNIFHYMMELEDEDLFKTLMRVMEDHVRDHHLLVMNQDALGRTPLHLVAARGRVARVELMCAMVPTLDFNATCRIPGADGGDVEGVTPLTLAIAHNQYEFVKYLLSAGKVEDLNARIVFTKFQSPPRFASCRTVQWSPLQLAAFMGHTRIAEKLVADDRVHVPSRVYFRDGESAVAEEKLLDTAPPVHLAALRGKPNLVKRLLKQKKVSLLHLDMAGNTAMHYALWACPEQRVHTPWMFSSVQECIHINSKQSPSLTSLCDAALKEAAVAARVDLDKPNLSGAKPESIPCSGLSPWVMEKKVDNKDTKKPSSPSKFSVMEETPVGMYTRTLDSLDMNAPVEWLESLVTAFEMALHSPCFVMEVSPRSRRTLLQMAVGANSVDMVTKVLMMVDEQRNCKVVEYFNKAELATGLTAMGLASMIANPKVVHVMVKYQNKFHALRASAQNLTPGDHELSENVSVVKVLAKFAMLPSPALPEEFQRRTESLGISVGGDFFRQDLRLHKSLLLRNKKVQSLWEELMSPEDVVPKTEVVLPSSKVATSILSSFLRTGASAEVQPEEQPEQQGSVSRLLNEIISEMAYVLPELLNVRDSAGLHLLHYLADLEPGDGTPQGNLRDTIFDALMEAMMKGGYCLDMNVRDNAGRTPLHLAAAQGFTKRVEFFANQPTTDLNATFSVQSTSVDAACKAVHNITALTLAAENNHSDVVKALLQAANNGLNVNAPVLKIFRRKGPNGYDEACVAWSPLQIASSNGHVQTLTELLQNEQVLHTKMKVSLYQKLLEENGASDVTFDKALSRASPLHLAALGRRLPALRILLKSNKTNPFALDDDLNTPLHYAARLNPFKGQAHETWAWESSINPNVHAHVKSCSDTNGCMNALLEAGLDMDAKNHLGDRAEYHGKLKFYDSKKRTSLMHVSVTAALVAATSFAGPASHESYDMEKFTFFDTLSFYFAMAAIVITLIPSLVGSQREGEFRQVKRAQRCLHGAVVLLFASIMFLICAFGAASAVVVLEKRRQYVEMVVSSSVLGGLTCFVVFLLFLRRLWSVSRSELRHGFNVFTAKKSG